MVFDERRGRKVIEAKINNRAREAIPWFVCVFLNSSYH